MVHFHIGVPLGSKLHIYFVLLPFLLVTRLVFSINADAFMCCAMYNRLLTIVFVLILGVATLYVC